MSTSFLDIATFSGNTRFLPPMEDDFRVKSKWDSDEQLEKGLLSATLVASKLPYIWIIPVL